MADLKPCGTRAGYKRHLDHREVPDEACVRANWQYIARYRKNATRARQDQDDLFRQLLDLIAGECRRAGMLS